MNEPSSRVCVCRLKKTCGSSPPPRRIVLEHHVTVGHRLARLKQAPGDLGPADEADLPGKVARRPRDLSIAVSRHRNERVFLKRRRNFKAALSIGFDSAVRLVVRRTRFLHLKERELLDALDR